MHQNTLQPALLSCFLKVPLSLHCTVGYTNADMRRTDSIQHVEPIAFEHLKGEILATVDGHAK